MSLSFRVWLAKSPILSLSISILQTKTSPEVIKGIKKNQFNATSRSRRIWIQETFKVRQRPGVKVRQRPGVKSVNDQDMLRIPTEFHVFIHSLLSPPQLFAPTLPIFGLATATSPADTMDKDTKLPCPQRQLQDQTQDQVSGYLHLHRSTDPRCQGGHRLKSPKAT